MHYSRNYSRGHGGITDRLSPANSRQFDESLRVVGRVEQTISLYRSHRTGRLNALLHRAPLSYSSLRIRICLIAIGFRSCRHHLLCSTFNHLHGRSSDSLVSGDEIASRNRFDNAVNSTKFLISSSILTSYRVELMSEYHAFAILSPEGSLASDCEDDRENYLVLFDSPSFPLFLALSSLLSIPFVYVSSLTSCWGDRTATRQHNFLEDTHRQQFSIVCPSNHFIHT